ncbi:ricin-type beta-trefoil lectin domain protein [Actinomadura sp. DC4]|uniref:RICIN domain-containing protein n=1 Tax=Actinomadura sp. DC4 TaxID=3055069 RepID=UPI0025B081D1|nr:ricin-type beta-trefoil lectin domain protein [Actinomadura sp. DC4]MDN3357721.1 ricin-type beta-trefoil lectin domain protein [Actinomadura sp. DC4]
MYRPLFTGLAGLTLVTSAALTPATAHAADFPGTLIRSNLSAVSKCIGPRNNETANGTPVVVMDCNQFWHGDGRDRSVRSFAGKCFSMAAGHPVPTPNGTPLVLRDCLSPVAGDQQWTFVAVTSGAPDGLFVLRNPGSLTCANVLNGSTATNTPVVMQNCSFRSDQQWFMPVKPRNFGFDEDDNEF